MNTNLSEVLQWKNEAVVGPLQHPVSLVLDGADQLSKLLKSISSFFQGRRAKMAHKSRKKLRNLMF
jgi:hypothetical protein